MKLTELQLRYFRNYKEALIRPGEGFNVFCGNNAQGKTNLLEAIYMLGYLKSFRPGTNEDLVQELQQACMVKATLQSQQVAREIKIIINEGIKRATLDGKPVRNASSVIGFLRPVLFSPEDVNIVKGSPSGRRSLLDRAVFQANPAFLKIFNTYEKALRHRNRLLKHTQAQSQVQPWTESLIENGAQLRVARSAYLVELTPFFEDAYRRIANGAENACLFYSTMILDIEEARKRLRQEFKAMADKERFQRVTLAGPHRDDPMFFVKGKDARLFASQGQQRSLMLAFKTAQTMELENRFGEPPLLLLDDMTSELDRSRRKFFYSFLLERRGQVFLTTTEPDLLEKEGFERATYFNIEQGAIQT